MNRFITSVLLLAGVFCGACDDRSSNVPQAVLDQASKPPEDTLRAPTTQELVSGHRSRTALLPLPLTMELPPGWRPLKDMPGVIQGYTPSGNEVQIRLVSRPSIKMDQLDHLVSGAKKEMQEKPQEILKTDLRSLGNSGVKVLERQKVGAPAELTVYDKHNQPHTSTEQNFTWMIEVLVPHDGAYQDHALDFIGLTKSQWDKDKDFLNSVLSTLAYAGDTAANGAATGAATQPTSTAPAPAAP